MPEFPTHDDHTEHSEVSRLPEKVEISTDGWKTNRYVDFEAGIDMIRTNLGMDRETAIRELVSIEHEGDDGEWMQIGTHGNGSFDFRKVGWLQKRQ